MTPEALRRGVGRSVGFGLAFSGVFEGFSGFLMLTSSVVIFFGLFSPLKMIKTIFFTRETDEVRMFFKGFSRFSRGF